MNEEQEDIKIIKNGIEHLVKFEKIFVEMGLLISGTMSALEGLRSASHSVEDKVTRNTDILSDMKSKLERMEFYLKDISNFVHCPISEKLDGKKKE